MPLSLRFPELTEDDVARLADDVAFLLQAGDVLGLEGDLGAGKSTFARALIRTLAGNSDLEVPSPTFTLIQSYETPRFEVAHLDLYRIADASDVDELGLDAALKRGIAVIEWPTRGGDRVPDECFTIAFSEADTADRRSLTLTAHPGLTARLQRLASIRNFVAKAGWGEASTRLSYLQGDASPRRYARLRRGDGGRAILMDSPKRPDGPPIRDGKPYSAIAHLAEDARAFSGVGRALLQAGVSAPKILAEDLDHGLLIIEDFGDRVFDALARSGADQMPIWQRATDTLIALQSVPPPSHIRLPDGIDYHLPDIDEQALDIETQLLLDWYWPAAHGNSAPQPARDGFVTAWRPVFARLLQQPKTWLLRDYHSPNLIALDDRASPRDIGIIDFQDAMLGPAAYDLVSLLQDARVDVAEALEKPMLERYIAHMTGRSSTFSEADFRFAYAALGAQRNTKILGIFARLAMRDGKRQYLAHLPRIWGYLERDLAHDELGELSAWYDQHLPRRLRRQALNI